MSDTNIKTLSPRKQEILTAAQKLFSEKGFNAASMRDVAKKLDIRPASLYSHYNSKDDILWEIAIRCANEFHQKVDPIAKLDLPIEVRLEKMITAHIYVIIKNINASAIFFQEWKHLNEPRLSEYAQSVAEYEALFRNLIQEGIQEGIFRNDLRPGFITAMILSSVNWIHQWYKPEGNMTAENIGKQAVRMILEGLYKAG